MPPAPLQAIAVPSVDDHAAATTTESADNTQLQSRSWALLLLSCSIAFWVLRLTYWSITYELPFSDMQDYDTVARHILSSWDFSMDPFWQSYKAPVLPLLRATELFSFGESFRAWQLFQAALTFLGLIWFAREIRFATNRIWPAAAFLITVTFSRPSIFWSLKLASEGVAEALLYLSCAAALFTWRRRSTGSFFLCGLIFSIAMLNRPNFMLAVGFLPAAIVIRWWLERRKTAAVHSPALAITAFACGVALLWAPWLVRSYRLYGHVVPFVTAGPTSFIYGVWEVPAVNVQGEIKSITWEKMLAEAPHRFQNDYEFYLHAQDSIRNWFHVYGSSYPNVVLNWIASGVTDRNVQLTKVSRLDLFPGALDELLFDKSPALIISGLLGLIVLPWMLTGQLGLIALLSIPAWLFACCLQSNPRFLEPMIPLFLFGNVSWLYLPVRLSGKRFGRSEARSQLSLARLGAISIVSYSALIGFSALTTPLPQPKSAQIANAGFESWPPDSPFPAGWTLSGSAAHVNHGTALPHEGVSTVELVIDGERAALYQDFEDLRALTSKQFSLSVWVRATDPESAYLAAVDGDKWYYSKRNERVGDWEKLEITDTPISDRANSFRIHLYLEHGTALFDDVTMKISR